MPDTNQSTKMECVPSDIPGFDELCDGGLLKERIYHVSGTEGSGKTIFGQQYVCNGITEYGETTHPYEITPKRIVLHPDEEIYSSKRH